MKPAAQVSTRFSTEFGNVTLSEEFYRPLLEYLESKNFRAKDLREYAAQKNLDTRAIVEAITFLVNAKHVMPCQSDAAINLVKKSCERLNDYICGRANFDDKIHFLASPLTGCGVAVNRLQQIFLAQYKGGDKSAEKLSEAAWKIFVRQGKAFTLNGMLLKTPEENLEHLKNLAEMFLTSDLPRFRALLIA